MRNNTKKLTRSTLHHYCTREPIHQVMEDVRKKQIMDWDGKNRTANFCSIYAHRKLPKSLHNLLNLMKERLDIRSIRKYELHCNTPTKLENVF